MYIRRRAISIPSGIFTLHCKMMACSLYLKRREKWRQIDISALTDEQTTQVNQESRLGYVKNKALIDNQLASQVAVDLIPSVLVLSRHCRHGIDGDTYPGSFYVLLFLNFKTDLLA